MALGSSFDYGDGSSALAFESPISSRVEHGPHDYSSIAPTETQSDTADTDLIDPHSHVPQSSFYSQ
jgi:hypothetical protein